MTWQTEHAVCVGSALQRRQVEDKVAACKTAMQHCRELHISMYTHANMRRAKGMSLQHRLAKQAQYLAV